MPTTDIPLKPGFYSDSTPRDAGRAGFWKDGDKVRFFAGQPQKLGGWTRGADDAQFEGLARGSIDWRTTRSEIFIGVGTHLKLYAWSGGVYYNITPLRATATLTDPFTTTIGLDVVTVADVAHGAAAGDRVFFSGATAVGGITIDGEYEVTEVLNVDSYTITHSAPAGSTAGPGGGTATAEYEISPGAADSVAGQGWGVGVWGAETWGTPRTVAGFLTQARTWQLEQWGEDLIANPRQGAIYVWDTSGGTGTRATLISQAPTTAKGIFVSPEDRHLIALGAHDGSADDPLLIRWCDQENYTDWTPTLTNTAGSKRLDTGNEILCALKVRGENLVFTDSALFSMNFVGPPDTFGFRTLGDNGNLAGPLAARAFEGIGYWMGDQDFFVYDGVTRVLDCSVTAHVFDDFNKTQKAKVYCGINRDFREVWWLYPSANSDECDRYVIYNIQDKLWVYGTLARTMLIGDSDVLNYVYGMGTDGYIYTHESGTDDYTQAMSAFIESGDIEIAPSGGQIMHISKMFPDFKVLTGTTHLTFTGKKYPQASETQSSGPHDITSATEFINPRVRCRQIAIRIDSDALGDDWCMGGLRVDLLPHGGR